MCEILSYRKRFADYFNKRLTVLGQKQWEKFWTLSARRYDANSWRALWTLSARRYIYKRLAVILLIFRELSGPYRLAVFSIAARCYLALTEQFSSSSPF